MNIREAENMRVLETLVGSRLYGTNTESSDWDYRGVFVAPIDTKVGLII
jgi:predicted nucleotidyltransferase